MNSRTKTCFFAAFALIGPFSVSAQTVVQINFGSFNNVTNWNRTINASTNIVDAIDSNGDATTIDLTWSANTGSTTGPSLSLPLPAPYNANSNIYNSALYVQGTPMSFTLSGLDTGKSYDLDFFGSRDNGSTRITDYSASNGIDNTTVSLQTSGTDLGGSGINYNNSNTALIANFSPNASGEITVTIATNTGSYGYVNGMTLTQVPEPSSFALLAGILGLGLVLLRRRR